MLWFTDGLNSQRLKSNPCERRDCSVTITSGISAFSDLCLNYFNWHLCHILYGRCLVLKAGSIIKYVLVLNMFNLTALWPVKHVRWEFKKTIKTVWQILNKLPWFLNFTSCKKKLILKTQWAQNLSVIINIQQKWIFKKADKEKLSNKMTSSHTQSLMFVTALCVLELMCSGVIWVLLMLKFCRGAICIIWEQCTIHNYNPCTVGGSDTQREYSIQSING